MTAGRDKEDIKLRKVFFGGGLCATVREGGIAKRKIKAFLGSLEGGSVDLGLGSINARAREDGGSVVGIKIGRRGE